MIGRRPGSAEPVGRVYAIGDVHGRYDLFCELMHLVRQDQAARPPVSTQIILLGDIVDRGPASRLMVQGCMNMTATTDRFLVLKGNHEEMMADAMKGDLAIYGHWLNFGGRETLRSWGVSPEVVDGPVTRDNLASAADAVGTDVVDWLEKLPLYHRHGAYLLVHAGIRPGIPLRRQRPEDLLWITEPFLRSQLPHDALVVHGHSISEDGPDFRENRIGIDTGAYRTGRLTALGIEGPATWVLSTGTVPMTVDTDIARHPAFQTVPARAGFDANGYD